MWHTFPDLGAGTFNLGDLANDNGYTSPFVFRSLVATATGSGVARIGESAGPARGLAVSPTSNNPLMLPMVGENSVNQLQALSVYVPSGCTVQIAFEY
jgi:hypothetical protein